jgi:hypothetical protein
VTEAEAEEEVAEVVIEAEAEEEETAVEVAREAEAVASEAEVMAHVPNETSRLCCSCNSPQTQ